MPEVKPNFARDWVEFNDPAKPEELYKCDLTWLTSYWTCIYGSGCCGIDADKPDAGCCSDGAYYSDEDDEKRTLEVAKRLTRDMWQYFDEAQPKKAKGKMQISEVGLDKDRKTKKIDDSCIFLNRKGYTAPGFTGDFGCVLHHLAQKEDIHFVETKPDVCWQLPIRRSFEQREFGEQEITVNVIGEYERLAWGDGGAEFDWDEDDEKRTLEVAKRLTRDMGQYFDEAQPKKAKGKMQISEVGLDKDRKTKKIDDSCIFLNRKGYTAPGFTGDFGCVLHHLAQKEDIHFVETKPDVCWQLPIRRSFEQREFGEQEITVNVIGEYERLAWGDGGAEFDWYCTSNTEAHVGREPVYLSNKVELTALMGEPAYAVLKMHCDNRIEAIAAARKEQKKRELPLFVIHPATLAAGK